MRYFLCRNNEKKGRKKRNMFLMEEKSRRFGDLTYQEIGTCAQQGWLAIIPTGCTEQQGPHLPVDFDTWFAETLMIAAAEKAALDSAVQAIVVPTILSLR